MASRRVVSFSRIPTITSEKLNGKNYLSWSASVQLWFLDQGFHDHLEQDGSNVPSNQVEQWKRTDFQLSYFGNLWNPNDWVLLSRLKRATPYGKGSRNIFLNAFTILPIGLLLKTKRPRHVVFYE